MTRLTFDRDVLARLRHLDRPAELCDESGAVVGVFTPAARSSLYRGLDSPASEKELVRSEHEPARPLSAILRDLEGRA